MAKRPPHPNKRIHAQLYYLKHKDEIDRKKRIFDRETNRRNRSSILEILGLKCAKCGFDDIRALQIDHVNGDGKKERKNTSSQKYYKQILEKVINGSKDYQILCANCNAIKRIENKEYKILMDI